MHVDRAATQTQLPPQHRPLQGAAHQQLAIRLRAHARQTEGSLTQLQSQQPGLIAGLGEQSQLTRPSDLAALAHPGAELLQFEFTEIKQQRGLEIAQGLARELQHPLAEAQEAVGHRFQQGAAHKQLQIGAALLPLQARAREHRKQAQSVAAGGQAQFEAILRRLERDAPAQINAVGRRGTAQGEIEVKAVLPEGHTPPLQRQRLITQGRVLQAELGADLRQGAASPQAVAPIGRKASPQALRDRREQGHQGQRQVLQAEAAATQPERPLQPRRERGSDRERPVSALLAPPEMTAGSEIEGEAVEPRAHKRELGIEASVEISGGLPSVTRSRGLGSGPLAPHLQQGRELIVEAAPEGVDRQQAQITGPTGSRQTITTPAGPGELQLIQEHRLQATPHEATPDLTALLPAQADVHLAAAFGQPAALHGVATIPEPATGLERPPRQTEQLRLLHGHATGDCKRLQIKLPLACEQALQGLKQATGA